MYRKGQKKKKSRTGVWKSGIGVLCSHMHMRTRPQTHTPATSGRVGACTLLLWQQLGQLLQELEVVLGQLCWESEMGTLL